MQQHRRTAAESELLESISQERLWQDTQVLGARYRASGTPEERAAVKYIVDELTKLDIDVQVYELNAYLSYHRSAACEIVSPEHHQINAVARAYTESTPSGGLELDVVVAGEYDGDLSDKAVLTARDWPGSVRGARLQIHAQTTNEPNLHRGGGTGVWGTPTIERQNLLGSQPPAINISRPDGETLRDLVRRSPVRIKVQTEVETGWRRISFPVATIPGQRPTFVLTGGHLDSHDPGVTDNATGCACLLEIARVFNERRDQLVHGLRIGWWTGHESAGYAGSTWYCDNNWEDLHRDCVLYWNNDGPGIRGATNIEGRYIFPQAQEYVMDLIWDYFDRKPEIMAKPLKMGDQSFWSVGVPSASVYRCLPPDDPDWAVVFGAGHGRWWHSTEDTMDRVDPGLLADDTRFYALALHRLCSNEVPPFEYVTYADWMSTALAELDAEAGGLFDLAGLIQRVNEFGEAARALRSANETLPAGDAERRHLLAHCLMRLNRYLNPIFFTKDGPYDQDLRGTIPGPAVRYPLPGEPPFQPRYFPGLQAVRRLATTDPNGVDYPPLYTTLLRERNRVTHGLMEAIDEVNATLRQL